MFIIENFLHKKDAVSNKADRRRGDGIREGGTKHPHTAFLRRVLNSLKD